jgi:molybdopterin/thiamine biosynthesis adenylyltransferase
VTYELILDEELHGRVLDHLFQDDRDEHAAVVLAGESSTIAKTRLLGRELVIVPLDAFTPGRHGYRQIEPRFVAEVSLQAAAAGLAYVSLHSHPGADRSVSLSRDDRDAHERLFPHLHDITAAPVTGVALGQRSAAGEVWVGTQSAPLSALRVVGHNLAVLTERASKVGAVDARFDRQARLFGAAGQELLGSLHVGVVGAGGGGSILVQQLAHLGVGRLTVVDFDVVKKVNLSRIVGATSADIGTKKIDVLRRLAQAAAPGCVYTGIDGDIADADVAAQLLECDFLFLATDTISSRLVFNAIVHRHLIPGIQIGAKVDLEPDGSIGRVYVAVRPVTPTHGCLQCNSLIDPLRLQAENQSAEERVAQNYLNAPEIIDPSVITLNGIAASHASTVMLCAVTGLGEPGLLNHRLFFATSGDVFSVSPKKLVDCVFCGSGPKSMYALGGPVTDLPVRRPTEAAGIVGPTMRHGGFLRGLLGRLRRT